MCVTHYKIFLAYIRTVFPHITQTTLKWFHPKRKLYIGILEPTHPIMAALLIVDLQADFLDSKQDQPAIIDPRPFVRLLPPLIRGFSMRQLPIIWVNTSLPLPSCLPLRLLSTNIVSKIKSAYPAVPHNTCCPFPGQSPSLELQKFESYLTSTHTSSRLCTPASDGAAILPSLVILKHPHHITIEKSWYSAFTNTNLHEALQSGAVTQLFIAGVTTNTCVAATSVHARRLGYDVTVIVISCSHSSQRRVRKHWIS